MSTRSPRFRISGAAWHAWEQHDVAGDLVEIVDALLALPDDEVAESRVERLPIIQNWLVGRAFGRSWRVLGAKNADREWEVIHEVHPLDSEEPA